jgi:hypothetical protein
MANWGTIGRLGDPSDPEWRKKNLTEIEPVPGQRFSVYGPAAGAFVGFLKDLAATGYPVQSSGGFNYRNIRGSDKLSQHAFGTAIDINAATNPLGGSTDLPSNVAELAQRHGLEWGGNWKGRPDPMHFEYAGNNVTNPVPQSGQQALMQPAPGGSSGAPSLLSPPNSMLPPLAQTQPGDGFAPMDILGQKFKPMQDAMSTMQQGWTGDQFMKDMMAGQNPLKHMVLGSIGNIFKMLI